MDCRRYMLKFLAGMLLIGMPVLSSAIDLPIKKIDGKDYYYYNVKAKETVFGLCRNLNLTKAEIVKYNPSVADGLRAGDVLYFPVELLDSKQPEQPAKNSYDNSGVGSIPINRAASHHVQKGETIYGICRHYGISEEDLIALNPSLKGGALKQGTILLLPDSEGAESTVGNDNHQYASDTHKEIEPKRADTSMTSLPDGDMDGESSEDVSERPYFGDDSNVRSLDEDSTDEMPDTLRVSVLLPFMLDQEHPDKQAQFYTEFYKGFLMAVDSLRNYSMPLIVDAYDTSDNIDSVRAILNRPELLKSNMIVAPDGDDQLDVIASFGRNNRINVLNIFAVKNTDYTTNPYVIQSNIPHSDMYDRAVAGVFDAYPTQTMVFLSSLDGKTDKREFIDKLKAEAERTGHPFVEISYHGYLKGSDLETLSGENEYLFIPASGTHSEYNHIISTLKTFKESRDDYNKALLFGYPEWITFPNEAMENMHFMNATIYSRFFNDSSSLRSKNFTADFTRWYEVPLMNAIPVQGILGFDTGFYLIKALNDNVRSGGNFDYDYDGIQSSFRFTNKSDIAGKVNDSLYFINFRPSGIVDKRILE